jgi:hypothetical protein
MMMPTNAGSTSRSQVNWSFGLMPDQTSTLKKISSQIIRIFIFTKSL